MATTGARTLHLLGLLQNHRHWSGADLARRLEVSPRTLRRDVDRLRELGYPVRAVPGVDGGYRLSSGTAMPPLLLDDEEAVALAVALHAAATSPVAGTAESAARAMAKLGQVLPHRLRGRVDAVIGTVRAADRRPAAGPVVDPDVLMTLALACRDHERVCFGYGRPPTDAGGPVPPAERNVEPHQLVTLGQRWYLLGFDVERDDWRTFRLDRVTGAHGTRLPFRPRELPAVGAAEFVRAGVEAAGQPLRAEIVLRAADHEVTRRLGPWVEVERIDDTRTRVVVRADSYDWAAFVLGVSGAEAERVQPPEAAVLIAEWADRLARATDGHERDREGGAGVTGCPA